MARITGLLAAITALLAYVTTSCTNDNEEELFAQATPCDTTTVTFSGTVRPILAAHCYSCHSTALATEGVILDTYAGVKEEADHGHLVGVITHAPGFPPMPQNGPKLASCDIEKIKKWVEAGAPDN